MLFIFVKNHLLAIPDIDDDDDDNRKNMYRICDKIGRTKFYDSEIIRDIESAKINPNFDINDGYWSILMQAILWNREELVKYILTYSNIDVNTHAGGIMWGNIHIHILKLLLAHKDFDVNIQDRNGQTGLHYACARNNIENVKELLLDARVNTLIRDNWGNTALDIAIRGGHHEIAKMLHSYY